MEPTSRFWLAVDPGPEARREGEKVGIGQVATTPRARNACTAPDRRASLDNACAVGRLPSRNVGKAAAKLSCPCYSQAMQGRDGGPRRCLSMYIQSIRYISVYTVDTTILATCVCLLDPTFVCVYLLTYIYIGTSIYTILHLHHFHYHYHLL